MTTRGSTLEVSAGTTPLITLDDQGYPVGNVGLATGDASARFDNVRLDPGTDAAEGAAVTASTSYEADGWGLAAATDGRRGLPDGSLGWSSLGNMTTDHGEWVAVDLGATRRIGRVDLHPRADGGNAGMGFPVDFTVQVSTDNATWTTVADRKDYPGRTPPPSPSPSRPPTCATSRSPAPGCEPIRTATTTCSWRRSRPPAVTSPSTGRCPPPAPSRAPAGAAAPPPTVC
ncbi:discoidin domain-containing protein [Kitasatospora aburaviensis]